MIVSDRVLDLEYKTNNKSNKNKKKEYTLSTYLLPRFSLSFILSVDLKSDLKIRKIFGNYRVFA